ncbi:Biopolymer transport protein ExbD/TolR [sediment metagenome]|uniref:Biopolymer transport protein ExbD/TolR n=1 Tax=sediment metagenome TaxID=749907 RepID=D9PI87_9ZZZZ
MAKNKGEDPKLDMTPMIDCVFQLLIFFLVSLKPEDIIAHLDVNRPAPDSAVREEKPIDLIQVGVFADGFTLNGRAMRLESLEGMLKRLADLSKTQTILIKCAPDSQHERLVQVLDLCSQVGLSNLSVMSM